MSRILFVASLEREIGFFFVFVILPSLLTEAFCASLCCLFHLLVPGSPGPPHSELVVYLFISYEKIYFVFYHYNMFGAEGILNM